MSTLSHDEAFAELDAVAFDLLDATEREAVMAHVSSCATCRAELDALQATSAELAFAARSPAVPAVKRHAIRDRLVSRATADSQARRLSNPPLVFPKSGPAEGPSGRRPVEWYAMAATVLLAVSLGFAAYALRDRQGVVDALKTQIARSERMRRTADSLSDQLAARDSLIAGIAGRDVSVMTLTSAAAKDPYARMFWDRQRHTWTMIAHNMPELKNGRTYQLWLVTPKAKISAGTFVARNGDAVVRATYDLTDSLQAIAVTDEPSGGVPQPTGPIVVAAAAASK